VVETREEEEERRERRQKWEINQYEYGLTTENNLRKTREDTGVTLDTMV